VRLNSNRASTDFSTICRNPNVEERICFCEIIQQLQKSDYELLKWSTEDVNTYSKGSRTIGAPLELGKELFVDLQNTYVPSESA
jgi:hypothetical protein